MQCSAVGDDRPAINRGYWYLKLRKVMIIWRIGSRMRTRMSIRIIMRKRIFQRMRKRMKREWERG